jgi:hypothetical protein
MVSATASTLSDHWSSGVCVRVCSFVCVYVYVCVRVPVRMIRMQIKGSVSGRCKSNSAARVFEVTQMRSPPTISTSCPTSMDFAGTAGT